MSDHILENIKSRRSVRNFKEEPVPKEAIEKIVEAGRFAPSALNRQPWKFIIINDAKLIEELSHIAQRCIKRVHKLIPLLRFFIKEFQDQRVVNAIKKTVESNEDTVFYKAPLLIFVANDKRIKGSSGDCYLTAQNMLLTAHALGVGGCFIGRGKAIPKSLLLKKLNLPAYYDINIHLAFGFPKEFPKTVPARREGTVQWT